MSCEHCVVRGTQRLSDGSGGFSFASREHARVELRRSFLDDAPYVAFLAYSGEHAIEDSVIVAPLTNDRQGGRGMNIEGDAVVRGRRVVVETQGGPGCTLFGGSVELEDFVFLERHPDPHTNSRGINGAIGSSITLRRGRIEGHHDMGVGVIDPGSSATIDQLTVTGTNAFGVAPFGFGLYAGVQSTMTASNVTLDRNTFAGALALGNGAALSLTDAIVSNTASNASAGVGGAGVAAFDGATLDVSRLTSTANRAAGVIVSGLNSTASLVDVRVQDILGQQGDGMAGRGLSVQLGAHARVERLLVERGRDIGVHVYGEGAVLDLSDGRISDMLGLDSDGTAGKGLSVEVGGLAQIERVHIQESRDFGVLAIGQGSRVVGSDLLVEGTRAQACQSTTCDDTPNGTSLAAVDGASFTITSFSAAGGALCGVMVADSPGAQLSRGRVTDHPIGACVQTDPFDLAQLSGEVLFERNTSRLQSTRLPLPTPSPPLGL